MPSVPFSPDGMLFAYGRDDATVVVARSPFAPCPGDLDGDRDVDLADLALLLSCYGRNEGCDDIDGDGDADLAAFGQPCP